MSTQKFASFAPYTPPPDDRTIPEPARPRPWFPSVDSSYQSGAIPTFNTSASGGPDAVEEAETRQTGWETRFGFRVDLEAAMAYLLGPISALIMLIIETQNDYVRFHAYQSALLTTPLVVVRVFLSLLQFPSWMRTFMSLIIFGLQFFMMYRAYIDAAQNDLSRYMLPYRATRSKMDDRGMILYILYP
ncbi:hypothetical protein C8J56DRAFT_817291 [Mycena floridula]|nr:hypothetical protein C8J56DRAFT_817291 [Mycena floridula]